MSCLFTAIFLFLAISHGLAAIESTETAYLQSEYLVETWQTEQGLPDNYITSITQTPDGYLWIATFNGLARFNSVDFVVFDAGNTPELPSSRIVELHADRKGRLWIRSEYGHVTQWAEGRFKTFTQREGLTNQGITFIQEDHLGSIWASASQSETNYYRFADGVFEPASSTNTFYDRFGKISDIHGYGWGIRSNFLFSVNSRNCLTIPGFRAIGTPTRLVAARDGGIWVIAPRVEKFHQGGWQDCGTLPIATDQYLGWLEDQRGNVWIGTGVGELWQASTNHPLRRFKLLNSTTAEPGRCIFEDAEANLWIGTGGNGLIRLKPRAFKTYDSRDGLTSDVVRSVAEDRDGNIWLATVNKVDWFSTNDPHHARSHPLSRGLPWTVFGGHDGAVWIGFFGQGLCRVNGESVTWFKPPTRDVNINVLFQDQAGEIHLGTPSGFYRIAGDSLAPCERPAGLPPMDIRCMAESRSGQLYVGLNGEGLLRKTANRWERFTTRDGLADDRVWSLYVDRDEGLWIGTDGHGLTRLKDGRFFNFDKVELPSAITCILEDDMDHLWFGSNQGLFRAQRSQLNDLADGRASSADLTRYNRADGMGSGQCTADRQPTAWKGRDGRLWFATMGGVTVVDPRSLPLNTRPPPVAVEGVSIDDKRYSSSALNSQPSFATAMEARPSTRINVPAGAHRLEFHFAALSFTAPDRVRFQYRLEGFEKDWVKANSRFAHYTKVPPGDYRFQVIAANNDNVWNKTGASLAVVVQPYLWQTGWFQISSAFLLVGGAAGLVRYLSQMRLRRRLAELERRHALENERGRISRDLHDHLGADLSQLALWSELAVQEKDRPEKMVERVGNVSSLAREVIQNVDEIVWTMNPKNDSLDRFAAYVCEFSERLVTGAGLRFRWEAPDKIPPAPLSSDLRHHLFLVMKEALNNVVKHAGATEARVELGHANGQFVLAISDNGRGFDAAASSPASTGNGLVNMHQRVAQCSGELTISSKKGEGTSIRITIPIC